MLLKDKIADKEYLYLNSIEELGFDIVQNINLENFLVGVVEGKGRVRLVTNERMLVVINASNAAAVYKHINNKVLPFSSSPIQKVDVEGIDSNYMSFDAVGGHAHFHLSCKQCADGKEFSYQYDFIGKIHKNINQGNLSMYADYSSRSVILFPLTNVQASNVYNTVEGFYNQSEAGKYKTVPFIENCITFPNRIYNNTFDGAFLDYMRPEEIMNGKEDVFAMGFSQNHYQVPKHIDSNRTEVRKFVLASLGEGFEKNWDQHKDEPINYELAKNNSFILERIEIILRSWEHICTAFYKDQAEIWNFKITDKALSKMCVKEPTSITYFDLYYYYYTFKYVYEKQAVFKDTAYAQYLNDHPTLDGVDLICHVRKYKDLCKLYILHTMERNPTASEPCHITELVHISLNNALKLESKTALIEKLDQCFVIDENMLSTCPNVNAYNSFTPWDDYEHLGSSNDWDMCMVLP